MLERESELDAFKQVNLTVIAAAHGYEVVRKKSTRASVLMSSGSDKILVSKQGAHYVYCSVFDPQSQGTAIDFAQKVIEPECSMGRVRQLLRPFLSAGYLADVQSRFASSVAKKIEPSQVDLEAVANRFGQFQPVAGHHKYLCDVRGVPAELLTSKRLEGRVYQCPRRGTVIFPHYGSPDGVSNERCLTGYEIKGEGISLFAKAARKGLFTSNAFKGDKQLVIAESGLDAISYLACRGDQGTRLVSIAGRLNPTQPALIRSAVERLGRGDVIVAVDNDKAGDEFCETLERIVKTADAAVLFRIDRPLKRGADWNDVVLEKIRYRRQLTTPSASLGR
jgi:hypothetical protein